MEMDVFRRPSASVEAFRAALALGLPQALAEGCLVRLAEATRASGDVEGARKAAAEYLRQFPNGRHVPGMRALSVSGHLGE
jgi:hypothetical protein